MISALRNSRKVTPSSVVAASTFGLGLLLVLLSFLLPIISAGMETKLDSGWCAGVVIAGPADKETPGSMTVTPAAGYDVYCRLTDSVSTKVATLGPATRSVLDTGAHPAGRAFSVTFPNPMFQKNIIPPSPVVVPSDTGLKIADEIPPSLMSSGGLAKQFAYLMEIGIVLLLLAVPAGLAFTRVNRRFVLRREAEAEQRALALKMVEEAKRTMNLPGLTGFAGGDIFGRVSSEHLLVQDPMTGRAKGLTDGAQGAALGMRFNVEQQILTALWTEHSDAILRREREVLAWAPTSSAISTTGYEDAFIPRAKDIPLLRRQCGYWQWRNVAVFPKHKGAPEARLADLTMISYQPAREGSPAALDVAHGSACVVLVPTKSLFVAVPKRHGLDPKVIEASGCVPALTGDEEFDERFALYARDPQWAQLVLSPAVMQGLLVLLPILGEMRVVAGNGLLAISVLGGDIPLSQVGNLVDVIRDASSSANIFTTDQWR